MQHACSASVAFFLKEYAERTGVEDVDKVGVAL
jgi:hypothetical protein